ncbi:MAG: hypothetical protein HYS44_03685 [Candidatus Niyogibacteria bacterium]|nr:hypothetical protein [Candidatus Niyogibacteria bacterium]
MAANGGGLAQYNQPVTREKTAMKTQNTLDGQTAKLIARIGENLPKDLSAGAMQGWINNPKALQGALRQALLPPDLGEKPAEVQPPEFKIWRTIKLGTHLNGRALYRALKRGGYSVTSDAKTLLKNPSIFRVTSVETEISLVALTRRELGLSSDTRVDPSAIGSRIKVLGLEPCPVEVGPQLRLQSPDCTAQINVFSQLMYEGRVSRRRGYLFTLKNDQVYRRGAWLNEKFLGARSTVSSNDNILYLPADLYELFVFVKRS